MKKSANRPFFPLLKELKALSDESRFLIVDLLLKRDYCVKALAREIKISEPAVSRHLKILRDAGLVYGTKKGYYVHYKVNRGVLTLLSERIQAWSEQTREEISQQNHAKDRACY